jgi:hypothetical protein
MSTLRITLAGALLFTVAGLRPAEGGETKGPGGSWTHELKRRDWLRLKKILPTYFWLNDPVRRNRSKVDAAWAKKNYESVRLGKRQFAELDGILRAGDPFTTEKNRSKKLLIATGGKTDRGAPEQMPVLTAVTSKYKPGCGKAFPLVITCHGGPQEKLEGAEQASATQFGCWNGFVDTIGCIVAAPALTGSAYGEREWTFLANLIAKLDRLYNVDRDRILLTGHSWGGILTWHMGPTHADTFCTLAPFVCAVNPGKNHLANCRALPIYHVQGRKDIEWIVNTGRERNQVLDDLGYEHEYREKDGGHDVFPGEIAKIAKYFIARPRKLYAKKLVRRESRVARNPSDFWYWIRSASRSFEAEIDEKSRTITVHADGPFEVFLHDRMLGLDDPFTIQRRDEVVWQGRVERRLSFALAHLRETRDKGRVFAASVKID